MQTAQITHFNFESHEVRTLLINAQPWFVATDVSSALEYRDAGNMSRNLDDDEKGTHIVSTPGGDQQMLIINESGLYSAILRSRKPEAKRFKKWVTVEVLPAIRKTGRYEIESTPAQQAPTLPPLVMQRWLITYTPSGEQRASLIPEDVMIGTPAELVEHLAHLRESELSTLELLQLTMKLMARLSARKVDFSSLSI